MSSATRPIGDLLREWRQRRRLSQLDLAVETEISPKHLSFIENGRSLPSRDMVLRLAEQLDIPLRERNTLLLAAGYAPVFVERQFDDPALGAARRAIDLVLRGHEPYPALAIDRHWSLIAANRAIPPLLEGIDAAMLAPPINVLRLSLHPKGLASRIMNLVEWRAHLLARLRRQIDLSADPQLISLLEELSSYPCDRSNSSLSHHDFAGVVVPLKLATSAGTLTLFSTTTIFGTPVDIMLSEIALESFFPADAATADLLRRLTPAEAARQLPSTI